MLVFGYALARFSVWAQRDPLRLPGFCSFLPFCLFWTRADSTMLMRPLVWYGLGSYALVYFYYRSFLKARQRRLAQGRLAAEFTRPVHP